MKRTVLTALVAIGAMAVLPTGAGARAVFDTDLEALNASDSGPDEYVISGELDSEKARCVGGRKLTITTYTDVTKRRGIVPGPVLDTDRSSRRGAWAFQVSVAEIEDADGFQVKAKPKDLKGNDRCGGARTEFQI